MILHDLVSGFFHLISMDLNSENDWPLGHTCLQLSCKPTRTLGAPIANSHVSTAYVSAPSLTSKPTCHRTEARAGQRPDRPCGVAAPLLPLACATILEHSANPTPHAAHHARPDVGVGCWLLAAGCWLPLQMRGREPARAPVSDSFSSL